MLRVMYDCISTFSTKDKILMIKYFQYLVKMKHADNTVQWFPRSLIRYDTFTVSVMWIDAITFPTKQSRKKFLWQICECLKSLIKCFLFSSMYRKYWCTWKFVYYSPIYNRNYKMLVTLIEKLMSKYYFDKYIIRISTIPISIFIMLFT